MRTLLYIALGLAGVTFIGAFGYLFLSRTSIPERVEYGVSFNTLYTRELGLDWRETYDAVLDDLGATKLRLAAHWPMVEPSDDEYNFEELDYQVREASARGADIIFAVGRRLPRWPECHVPAWAENLSKEEWQEEVREYIRVVVERYRDEGAITTWQVENEPYLTVFAYKQCGELDEEFLYDEIALVRELDDSRPILVTDSGNLGTWAGAWQAGDVFGTSVYRYFWNPDVGQFRSLLPASFYRVKQNVMRILYGKQQAVLIELAAEPWLLEPVTDVALSVQLERMNAKLFEETIAFARRTHLSPQYLWGAEWWYWLKEEHGSDEMWRRAQVLFETGR